MTVRPPRSRPSVDPPAPRGHFIQCRVPTDLYEWMRLQSFRTRRSMNSIALEAVTAYRAAVEAGHTTREGRVLVAGEIVKYNLRVGDDLYEWLRSAACHAHSSSNALVVAALARAPADQAGGTAAIDAD